MCTVQCRGAVPEIRNRSDGATDVSTAADTEAGSVPAGAASSAARHAANDGQRRHVLRASLPLHLHLQVFPAPRASAFAVSVSDFGFPGLPVDSKGATTGGRVGGPPKKIWTGHPNFLMKSVITVT